MFLGEFYQFEERKCQVELNAKRSVEGGEAAKQLMRKCYHCHTFSWGLFSKCLTVFILPKNCLP